MFETKIIDNLVNEEMQQLIHKKIMSANWTFLTDVSGVEGHLYPSHGFVHIMVHPDPKMGIISPLYQEVCGPILESLRHHDVAFKDNYYNRAFLQLPLANQYKKDHNGIHVDLPKNMPHIACVYYVNNSDGDTILYEQTIDDTPGGSSNIQMKEHMRVTPKRGRVVLFDGSRYHCSTQPSINYRCIINFDLVV